MSHIMAGFIMELETARFGIITCKDEDILTFTQPMLGFHAYRHFVFVPGPPESPLFWLQSVEDGELAFLLMDPASVLPDYGAGVRGEVRAELGAEDENAIHLYTTVTIPRDGSGVRTNLKAPIAVNPDTRLALQAVLDDPRYPVRFVLPGQAERNPTQQD